MRGDDDEELLGGGGGGGGGGNVQSAHSRAQSLRRRSAAVLLLFLLVGAVAAAVVWQAVAAGHLRQRVADTEDRLAATQAQLAALQTTVTALTVLLGRVNSTLAADIANVSASAQADLAAAEVVLEQRLNASAETIQQNLTATASGLAASINETASDLSRNLSAAVADAESRLAAANLTIEGQLAALASSLSSTATTLSVRITQATGCRLGCDHGGQPDSTCTVCEGCEAGWTGPFCGVPTGCDSDPGAPVCVNGGVLAFNASAPAPAACSCVCPPTFSGPDCATPVSNVSLAQWDAYMNASLAGGGNSSSRSAGAGGPRGPPPLDNFLGFYVAADGSLSLPGGTALQLTYNASAGKQWNGLVAPQEADLTVFDWRAPTEPEVEVRDFHSMAEFVAWAQDAPAGSAHGTMRSRLAAYAASQDGDLVQTYNENFTDYWVRWEAQYVPVLSLRLGVDPGSGSVQAPVKAPVANVLRALPNCTAEPAVCSATVARTGVGIVSGEVRGGARGQLRLLVPSTSQVPRSGGASSWGLSACLGGDPALCQASMTNASLSAAWAASVVSGQFELASIRVSTEPLTALVSFAAESGATRRSVGESVSLFVAGVSSDETDRCPTCANNGTCASPLSGECGCGALSASGNTTYFSGRSCGLFAGSFTTSISASGGDGGPVALTDATSTACIAYLTNTQGDGRYGAQTACIVYVTDGVWQMRIASSGHHSGTCEATCFYVS